MKIEKYFKQDGAYTRVKYREVPDIEINIIKGNRANSVDNIIVNVQLESGAVHQFQGDETSQNRLVRAGWALEHSIDVTIPWKTADNQIVILTVTDIAQILIIAGIAQTKLWF